MTADQQALAKQIRAQTALEVLRFGNSIEDEDPGHAQTATAARRIERKNKLRAIVREAVSIDGD